MNLFKEDGSFKLQLKKSAYLTLIFTLIFGIAYPIFIYGIGQLFFRKEAKGSLSIQNDKVVGSLLIGQNFKDKRYFHPRPSAAGEGYDGASSSGSNLGPTSQKLIEAIKTRARGYRLENNLSENDPIPADAVTASASGLDPHITLENAHLQAPRVASSRSVSIEQIVQLIDRISEGPTFGLIGPSRVNVLLLNLELDKEYR